MKNNNEKLKSPQKSPSKAPSEGDPLNASRRLQEDLKSKKDTYLTSPMKDLDDFDIERYNNVFNESESSKEETMLVQNDLILPFVSNRSYKNDSEDENSAQRNNVPRPGTFQGAPVEEEESFDLLKSGESMKQRGTAGFGEPTDFTHP